MVLLLAEVLFYFLYCWMSYGFVYGLIGAVVASLVWWLPNYIYFQKRSGLFSSTAVFTSVSHHSIIYCKTCGTPLNTDDVYCCGCGGRLE